MQGYPSTHVSPEEDVSFLWKHDLYKASFVNQSLSLFQELLLVFFFFFEGWGTGIIAVLDTEPKISCMQGKCFTS